MARVAFIGLGTMGLPMARNLVAAGHELVGCDLDPRRVEAAGIPAAATPAEAFACAEVAITSLPSPGAVEQVVLGPDGLRPGARRGTTVIDMSTSSPALARRLAAELEAAGVDSLDAPVSGGPRGAESATLAIMVGGRSETFERWRGLLGTLGARVVHVGGPGAGQAAKLANNLITGVTMTAVSEACAIAAREGIHPGKLYEVITGSTGDSRVLRGRFPLPGVDPAHPSSNAFAAMFTVDLMAKDLALAVELAAENEVEAPLLQAALDDFRRAQEEGLGGLDYSAVYLAKSRRRHSSG